MRPLVMKFGGTSVADAAAIRRVVAIVARAAEADTPLVVVSAMAGVTDALLRACDAAREADLEQLAVITNALVDRHNRVIAELFTATSSLRDENLQVLEQQFDELRSVLESVAILHELTPRASDRVVAAGELISSRIVASAMIDAGVRGAWLDARDALVTDDGVPALPLLPETEEAAARCVAPVLARRDVPVLGGFIGATSDGMTTTLGRGGSDLSAAILGAALDAREIQIWTDVDGMLTADPRLVSDARLVRTLSFGEASELAYFGAKVLHPSTILPAVEKNIPVRILNTSKPSAGGSVIAESVARESGGLTAIACKRQITVVDVTSTRMLLAHGFLRRVFDVFERHRTSVDVVTTSEVSVSMTVDDDRNVDGIANELSSFATVSVERDMAIVSAVGDGLRNDPTLSVRIISTLDRLPLRMVSQAASRRNVTVVLRDSDAPHAMNRLHTTWLAPATVGR